MSKEIVKAKKESLIRSSVSVAPNQVGGIGHIIFKSKGSSRWERFCNIVLFPFRYVWFGAAKL